MTTNATRQLKSTISKLFHFCGYDIVSQQKPGKDATPDNKIPEKPFNLLEIVIRDHITREPDFYFVEIGANDGVNFDPLRPLVLEHHLRGLLVEPLPDRFASLQSNYRSETQLSFENCAISAEDGERTLYRFQPDAPVEEWMHLLASFDKHHLLKYRKSRELQVEKYIEEVRVPTFTIKTLLAKHNIEQISLLQIDTEGYDYEIIKMLFAAGLFPAIINYEHVHLALTDQIECRQRLAAHGYGFLSYSFDTLAVRE